MGFRYRKSIRLGKGVRININKNSVGISAGVKGARVSLNSKGRTTTTVGIPGTGISYVHTDSVHSKGKRSSQAPSSSDFGSGLSPKKPPKKRKWLGGFIMAMSVYWIITALVMSFRDNTLGLIEYLAYLFTAFLGVPAFSYGLRIFKGKEKAKKVRAKAEPAKRTDGESFFVPADDSPILDMPNQFVYQDPDEIDVEIVEEVTHTYNAGPAPLHNVDISTKAEPTSVIKINLGIPKTYVSVDLETTGLSPINDKIIEIGGVKVVDDKVVAVFSELINPGRDIPPIITKITGLTSADLADKPTIDIVLPAFIDFVGSDAIVGHNIKSFDMKFLDNARNQVDGKAFKNKVFDTLHLSRKVVKDSDNHKLQTLLAFFGIKVEKAHRAVDDSYAVVELIRKLEQYS